MDTIIQEIDLFGNEKVNLFPGLLLALVGMMLYTFVQVLKSRRVKKFSEIKFGIWWDENQINFVFTVFICICMILSSWYADTLTTERCFFIGFMGNYVADAIIKFKYK